MVAVGAMRLQAKHLAQFVLLGIVNNNLRLKVLAKLSRLF
jgi:hypothetical protein